MAADVQTEMSLDREVPPDRLAGVDPTLPPEFLQIVGYLSLHCRGKENAATADSIGRFLGYDRDASRKIRQLISMYLEKFPFVVCGTPGDGFFVTTDPEDMRHYEASLYSVLKAVAVRISAFRRLAAKQGHRRITHGAKAEYAERAA